MTTKSQQQDELVNTFVASIPTMQTDIALLKQDTTFLKEASTTQSNKSDTIIDRIGQLSVVTKSEFEDYKKEENAWKEEFVKTLDARFKPLEDYNDNNSPGVKFANALVSRWTTFLVLLILTAAVAVIAGKFMPVGTAGV